MTDDCYMRTKAIQKEFEGKYFQSLFLQYTGLEGEKKSAGMYVCVCVCVFVRASILWASHTGVVDGFERNVSWVSVTY